MEATSANVHDVTKTSKLLTGEEEVVYGDSGYLGAGKHDDAIIRNKSRMEQPSNESSFASSPSSIPLNSGQLRMALRSAALILISVMVSSNG